MHVYILVILFGVIIPAIYCLFVNAKSVCLNKKHVNPDTYFCAWLKKTYYLSFVLIALTIIATLIFYNQDKIKGIYLLLILVVLFSIVLSMFFVRKYFLFIGKTYPKLYEKKCSEENINKILKHSIHAGYGVVFALLVLIVAELYLMVS